MAALTRGLQSQLAHTTDHYAVQRMVHLEWNEKKIKGNKVTFERKRAEEWRERPHHRALRSAIERMITAEVGVEQDSTSSASSHWDLPGV